MSEAVTVAGTMPPGAAAQLGALLAVLATAAADPKLGILVALVAAIGAVATALRRLASNTPTTPPRW